MTFPCSPARLPPDLCGRTCCPWPQVRPCPRCFAAVFPDGTHLGIGTDAAANKAAIAALSPKDAESFAAMSAEFGSKAPHLFGLLGNPMPFARQFQDGLEGVARRRRSAADRSAASPPLLARGFLDRHFDNEEAQGMMAAWGLHLDFPPDAAAGARSFPIWKR